MFHSALPVLNASINDIHPIMPPAPVGAGISAAGRATIATQSRFLSGGQLASSDHYLVIIAVFERQRIVTVARTEALAIDRLSQAETSLRELFSFTSQIYYHSISG